MRWLLGLVITATATAQPDLTDALLGARTPAEVVRIVQTWEQGGPEVATIYAHSQYDGSNGAENGSATRPYNSIADFSAAVAASDTIVLGGSFREGWILLDANVTIRKFTDSEWAAVPGATTGDWIMRGDVVATTWAAHGTFTNTFVASTNAATSKPASVVIDWDTRVFTDGRHNAHLEEAATALLCDSTAGTWFWNSGDSKLLVNPPTGVDLNTVTVAWCRLGHGLEVDADGVTVNDGTFYLWCDGTAGSGYSIIGSGVSNLTLNRCTAIDTGYHGMGVAVAECVDNIFNDCLVRSGTYADDSYFVFFANSTTTSGCQWNRCTAELSPLLKYTAVQATEAITDYIRGPAADAPNQTGFTCHTGTGSIAAGGVVGRNCVVRMLSVKNAAYKRLGAINGEEGAEPATKTDPSTYPVQYYDCDFECDHIFVGQGASAAVFTAAIAYSRCFFDIRSHGSLIDAADATPNSFYCNRAWTLLESCVVYSDAEAGTTATKGGTFRVRGGSTNQDCLYLSNTSVYEFGAGYAIFNRVDANPIVTAAHSVFRLGTGTRLVTGNTTDTNKYIFGYCWYDVDIGDTTFGSGTGNNAQSEWSVNIDANGRYDEDFTGQFVDDVTLQPAGGSNLKSIKDAGGNAVRPRGINLQNYAGNAGAWQFNLGVSGAVNGGGGGWRDRRWSRSRGR